MSDPMANVEIEDVLSSIRRLVSEEMKSPSRRAAVDAAIDSALAQDRATGRDRLGDNTAAAAALDTHPEQHHTPEKLVLTPAFRVDDDPETADSDTPDDDMSAAEMRVISPFEREADGFGWHRTRLAPDSDSAETDANGGEEGLASAEEVVEDLETLEATIAELEAAIAERDEFEPDGSEVEARSDLADGAALESDFEDGFTIEDYAPAHGAPVIGGARVEAPATNMQDVDEARPDMAPAPDTAADLQTGVADGMEDAQLVTADAAPAVSDEMEPDHPDVGGSYPAEEARPDNADAEPDASADWSGSQTEATPVFERRSAVMFDPQDDRHLRFNRGEAGRLSTLAFPATVEPEAADDASDAGVGEDESLESDEPGLFVAPTNEEVIDEAMLRDLVSEIIRQELQGILGERITRNVRKLVRREIQRALSGHALD